MHALKRMWIRLTYWSVGCDSCNGTGICTTTQAGRESLYPHSCCGECERVSVSLSDVPANWNGWADPNYSGDGSSGYDLTRYPHHAKVVIGSGAMYRRPWSREQIFRRPL